MTKIIKLVKKLNLPAGQYVVFGSGPLAVHGIRETRDVDIVVTKSLYQELKSKEGWKEKIFEDGTTYLAQGIYEIGADWDYGEKYNPTFEVLLERADYFDGVPFASLNDVIKWKEAFGREKDLKDLELINSHLNKNK